MNDKHIEGSGEEMLFDKGNKYEPCNISVIRKKLGLKQIEFAKMVGLTSALLSEIEHGKKKLTADSAKKMSDVLNKLINEPGKTEYQIDPAVLSAGHYASVYPEELQPYIMGLWIDINNKKNELDYILESGSMPTDVTRMKFYDNKNTEILSLLKSRRKVIQNNLAFFVKSEVEKDSRVGFISLSRPKF